MSSSSSNAPTQVITAPRAIAIAVATAQPRDGGYNKRFVFFLRTLGYSIDGYEKPPATTNATWTPQPKWDRRMEYDWPSYVVPWQAPEV